MAELAMTEPATELLIALGREGKVLAKPKGCATLPAYGGNGGQVRNRTRKIDYRKRQWIAETPNGWIKNVLGFREFNMRGLKKAQAEFKLVCIALNLRRMATQQGC